MDEPHHLSARHLALLRDVSGLSESTISERGYYTATTVKELRDLGFSEAQARIRALVIPLFNIRGEGAGVCIRPDSPRADSNGRPIKYESVRKKPPILDVPPRCVADMGDPSVPLDVVEGTRKADSIASLGGCAVSISGVWNWRGSNRLGGKVVLPDWESVALNGRRVRIDFDSDVATNGQVAHAAKRLKALLESRGATVQILYLPAGLGGAKQGVDDFLANGHSLQELDRMSRSEVADLSQISGGRKRIAVTDRHMRDIVQECWEVLIAASELDALIFQNAGRLVRLDLTGNAPVIRALSEADLHGLLERRADFVRTVGRGGDISFLPARLPRDAAVDILAAWKKPVRTLTGVTTAPIIDRTGSVTAQRGYDESTCLYYEPGTLSVPAVAVSPTESDRRRAVELLLEWLRDFPFADAAGRAHAIAFALTRLTREMIQGPVPLFAVSAPKPGTGKGLLVTTVGIIVEGVPPAGRDVGRWLRGDAQKDNGLPARGPFNRVFRQRSRAD